MSMLHDLMPYAAGRQSHSCRVRLFCTVSLLLSLTPLVNAQVVFDFPFALNTNAATDSGGDVQAEPVGNGSGTWIVVWYSTDSLGGTIGTDNDILFARSTDNGETWSAPAALASNAGTDSGSDIRPEAATDGAGNWIVVWRSNENLGGAIGTDEDILAATSNNDGVSWSAPFVLNTDAGSDTKDDIDPDVQTDGAGVWIASWSSFFPTAVWNLDAWVTRSTNNGALWSAPVSVHFNAQSSQDQHLHPIPRHTGGSNWMIILHTYNTLGGTIGADYDFVVSRSTNGGVSWSAVSALLPNAGTDTGADWRIELAGDGSGTWVAAWNSTEPLMPSIGTDEDVLISRSTDNGMTWSTPVAAWSGLAGDGGIIDQNPQVATDGDGNWIVTWHSSNTLSGTIGGDEDILFVYSSDNGATWSAAEALNANAATDAGNDAQSNIAARGTDSFLGVWQSFDSLGGTIGTDQDILIATSPITVTMPALGAWGLTILLTVLFGVAAALARAIIRRA